MSPPLIVTSEAEEDIAEAKAWYEKKRQGLGERFILSIEAALDHIGRVPYASSKVMPGVRRVRTRRFPYGVYFRIDVDQIAVIAVYHSKRDPRGWQSRA